MGIDVAKNILKNLAKRLKSKNKTQGNYYAWFVRMKLLHN